MVSSIWQTVVGAVMALAVGATPTIEGETCYHLEGYANDGGRHVDRLYLRTAPAANQFVRASFSPRTKPAATALSDVSGRGAWQRNPALDLGEWKCLAIEFEGTEPARRVWIWAHEPSGKLFYQGHDAGGRLLFSGEGQRR